MKTSDNLSNVDIKDQHFNKKNYSEKSFADSTFSNCVFIDCDFTKSEWQNVSLWSCTFKDCNLSLVELKKARLLEVTFIECNLVGIDFSKCDTSLFFSMQAQDCFIQYCNFSALTIKKGSFVGSKIYQTQFIDTNLEGVCFERSDLLGSTFHNCNLGNANFAQAKNYIIDPRTNKIKNAQFSFPECIGLLQPLEITILDV